MSASTFFDWASFPAGVKFEPTDNQLLQHLCSKVQEEGLRCGAAKFQTPFRAPPEHPLISQFIPTLRCEDGICGVHPEDLPGISMEGITRHYFHRPSRAYSFGTRKRRKIHSDSTNSGSAVDGGQLEPVKLRKDYRWHKTGKTRPVFGRDKQQIGWKKILVLYETVSNPGSRPSKKQSRGPSGGTVDGVSDSHRTSKDRKTNWIMHQYHFGREQDEKEGEWVVAKVFYQVQQRQSSRVARGFQSGVESIAVGPGSASRGLEDDGEGDDEVEEDDEEAQDAGVVMEEDAMDGSYGDVKSKHSWKLQHGKGVGGSRMVGPQRVSDDAENRPLLQPKAEVYQPGFHADLTASLVRPPAIMKKTVPHRPIALRHGLRPNTTLINLQGPQLQSSNGAAKLCPGVPSNSAPRQGSLAAAQENPSGNPTLTSPFPQTMALSRLTGSTQVPVSSFRPSAMVGGGGSKMYDLFPSASGHTAAGSGATIARPVPTRATASVIAVPQDFANTAVPLTSNPLFSSISADSLRISADKDVFTVSADPLHLRNDPGVPSRSPAFRPVGRGADDSRCLVPGIIVGSNASLGVSSRSVLPLPNPKVPDVVSHRTSASSNSSLENLAVRPTVCNGQPPNVSSTLPSDQSRSKLPCQYSQPIAATKPSTVGVQSQAPATFQSSSTSDGVSNPASALAVVQSSEGLSGKTSGSAARWQPHKSSKVALSACGGSRLVSLSEHLHIQQQEHQEPLELMQPPDASLFPLIGAVAETAGVAELEPMPHANSPGSGPLLSTGSASSPLVTPIHERFQLQAYNRQKICGGSGSIYLNAIESLDGPAAEAAASSTKPGAPGSSQVHHLEDEEKLTLTLIPACSQLSSSAGETSQQLTTPLPLEECCPRMMNDASGPVLASSITREPYLQDESRRSQWIHVSSVSCAGEAAQEQHQDEDQEQHQDEEQEQEQEQDREPGKAQVTTTTQPSADNSPEDPLFTERMLMTPPDKAVILNRNTIELVGSLVKEPLSLESEGGNFPQKYDCEIDRFSGGCTVTGAQGARGVHCTVDNNCALALGVALSMGIPPVWKGKEEQEREAAVTPDKESNVKQLVENEESPWANVDTDPLVLTSQDFRDLDTNLEVDGGKKKTHLSMAEGSELIFRLSQVSSSSQDDMDHPLDCPPNFSQSGESGRSLSGPNSKISSGWINCTGGLPSPDGGSTSEAKSNDDTIRAPDSLRSVNSNMFAVGTADGSMETDGPKARKPWQSGQQTFVEKEIGGKVDMSKEPQQDALEQAGFSKGWLPRGASGAVSERKVNKRKLGLAQAGKKGRRGAEIRTPGQRGGRDYWRNVMIMDE